MEPEAQVGKIRDPLLLCSLYMQRCQPLADIAAVHVLDVYETIFLKNVTSQCF